MEVTDSSRYVEPIFDDVTVKKDIVYSEVVNYKKEAQQLTLDVYQSENDTEVNRPAIIWIHGGGFTNGSKDSGLFEKDLAIDFAKKGYVTVDINYRLRDANTLIGFSFAYNDCENKIREHQIGWTAGISSDRATFGNLQFVAEIAK